LKKIVVTGGSGFIGTALCKSLYGEAEIAIADVRPPIDLLRDYWRYVDVTDSYSVFEVVEDADVVYHLAANPNPTLAEKNPSWDLTINVIGTLNVINACVKHEARILFTSSLSVKKNGNYAISKHTAEQYIQHYAKKGKLDVVIVRLANVYGQNQSLGFVIPDFIDRLKRNPNALQIRGTGYETRDFIFIDDAVTALRVAAEKGENGAVYEIGTGKAVTILELAEVLAKAMQLSPRISTEKQGTPPKVRDAANISPLQELGWTPKVTLEEGLKRCL